jgi:peptidoglycan hydrolase-like protein with peptidoglycan-binding domain
MVKKLLIAVAVIFSLGIFGLAQEQTPSETSTGTKQQKTEKRRGPVFRATKEQIMEVQKRLNIPQTGKMDEATRAAVKKYQSENGLRPTGGLNRATLEKMGIELTEKQKQIPVNPNSYASSEQKTVVKRSGPVFRATKEQIEQAQRMLKEKGYYTGEVTGKLDKDTREAIKRFQEASGLKKTGTLNAETLEKMGIQLTDKQKEMMTKKQQ